MKPFLASLRLTISMRSEGTLAAAGLSRWALYPLSAHMIEPGKAVADFVERGRCAIAVLDASRMDDAQRQSLRVDQRVNFPTIPSRRLYSALGYLGPQQFEDRNRPLTVKSAAI